MGIIIIDSYRNIFICFYYKKTDENSSAFNNTIKVTARFELAIRELQSHALPLGYGALYGAGEENRTLTVSLEG